MLSRKRALKQLKHMLPHDKQGTSIVINVGAGAVLLASMIFAFSNFARARKFKSTEDFVKKAAASGMFEIESSRLVLDHSENEDICEFAETMLNDHEHINEESNAALAKSNLDVTKIKDGLDHTHQKMLDKLNRALDSKFDSVYVEAQRKAHAEAVKLFSDYAKHGDDPVLKDFAVRVLPTLKQHQEMAQSITVH